MEIIHDVIIFGAFFGILATFSALEAAHKKWHARHAKVPKVGKHHVICAPFLIACGHSVFLATEHWIEHIIVYSGKFIH